MAKIVVMVSLYKSGDWIENRLINLLESSIKNELEIWCINTNSPDQRDHNIPTKFPVQYIRLDHNTTVYAAWNHIITNSNSVYLTNANSDDLISPIGYERLLTTIDKLGNRYGFVYPNWYTTNISNLQWTQITNPKIADPSGTPGVYRGDLSQGGVGHFPLWRRSLHNKLGLFNESFKALGDADWWARCYFLGKTKFHWLKEYLACYLWRDGQNLWHREINSDEWTLYHNKVHCYQSGQLS